MIEEKIEEMWARARKFMKEGSFEEHLPEQMELFSREILPPLALRAFFKGVGKLDREAANVVVSELGIVCGGFALGGMAASGLEIPTTDIDAFLQAHEKAENVASGGQSKLTRKGNTATLVITGGCVCPLVKTLQIEPTPNHCLCTLNHLKHLYGTGLGRPVEVELIETHLRGGSSCTIRMSW